MPGWLVAVIIVVAIAVAIAAIFAIVTRRRREQRTSRLRERFGPEYERTLERADGQKAAERDLERRAEQREKLDIRPLAPAARERYAQRWEQAQRHFVDDPAAAIADADTLVREVMSERGYPVDDFDQRADVISVDHPHLVENFRGASGIAHRSRRDRISTEDQRQAMVHFRGLFDELLGGEAAAGAPTGGAGQAAATAPAGDEGAAPFGEGGRAPTEGARPVERREPAEQETAAPAPERTVGERPGPR